MFNSKEKRSEITSTVIGEGITVEAGKIYGTGSVRIDGSFSGTIDIKGEFVLGETGTIDGDIRAEKILLAGKVTGTIECEGLIHVANTAVLTVDISAKTFVVDEGAVVNGHCSMSGRAVERSILFPEAIIPGE